MRTGFVFRGYTAGMADTATQEASSWRPPAAVDKVDRMGRPAPVRSWTLAQVHEQLTGPALKPLTAAARAAAAAGDGDRLNAVKAKLPGVVFSCAGLDRRAAKNYAPWMNTGLVALDIDGLDGLDDPPGAEARLAAVVAADPNTVMAWSTPRGYRAVIAAPAAGPLDARQHKARAAAAAKIKAEAWQLEEHGGYIDSSALDVTRLMLLYHDPGALLNTAAAALDDEQLRPLIEAAAGGGAGQDDDRDDDQDDDQRYKWRHTAGELEALLVELGVELARDAASKAVLIRKNGGGEDAWRRVDDDQMHALLDEMNARWGWAPPPAAWDRALGALLHANRLDRAGRWLDGLDGWDGRPRVEAMLGDLFRLDDDELGRWYGRHIASTVIRRMAGPAQIRQMPILIGPQHVGKNIHLELLLPPHLRGQLMARYEAGGQRGAEGKDAVLATAGCWIAVHDELDGLTDPRRLRRIKADMTTVYDRVRPPYARNAVDIDRTWVLIGMTNEHDDVPNDPTGLSRFVPIEILGRQARWERPAEGPDDSYDRIEEWMDGRREQWWAEALQRTWTPGRPKDAGLWRPGFVDDMALEARAEQAARARRHANSALEEPLRRAVEKGRLDDWTTSTAALDILLQDAKGRGNALDRGRPPHHRAVGNALEHLRSEGAVERGEQDRRAVYRRAGR